MLDGVMLLWFVLAAKSIGHPTDAARVGDRIISGGSDPRLDFAAEHFLKARAAIDHGPLAAARAFEFLAQRRRCCSIDRE